MKTDIILAGVGGQGILSIAAIIGLAGIENGLFLKQSEVHGMSQRGGSVQSHLRISSEEIASDLIPMGEADMIISLEPMESLRYLPWLSPEGWVVTSVCPFINIPSYPPVDSIIAEIRKLNNHIAFNSDEIAKNIGSPKSSNMIILGAATRLLNINEESFIRSVEYLFRRKGEDVVKVNIKAFRSGRNLVFN